MEALIDCICRKVHECLSGLKLQRPMKGGKNSKNGTTRKYKTYFSMIPMTVWLE